MSNWDTKFAKKGLTFDDVLLIPAESHVLPNEVDLSTQLADNLKLHIPLISAGMDTVTEGPMAIAMALQGGLGVVHKNMSIQAQAGEVANVKSVVVPASATKAAVDDQNRLLCAAAVGVTSDTFERAEALLKAGADAIVIDTAHGHSAGVLRKIKEIRDHFPDVTLIAGNVATGEATAALFDAGVDVVKVGIGPGSICTTRVVAGVGVPQITAIYDAATVAREYGKPIIADGGIRHNGDIAKSVRFGASMVMIGSMLAGHLESPGHIITIDGKRYKQYWGSASEVQKGAYRNVEGKQMLVPFRGSIKDTLREMQEDLQSSISYAGGRDLESIRKVDYVIVKNSILNGDY